MKKLTLVTLITIVALLAVAVAPLLAQPVPPTPVASPEAGRYVATPIGGGLVVLLSMIGYGIFRLRKKEQQ